MYATYWMFLNGTLAQRWLTLGNQLGPDQIYEEDLAARIKARYPERLSGVPGG